MGLGYRQRIAFVMETRFIKQLPDEGKPCVCHDACLRFDDFYAFHGCLLKIRTVVLIIQEMSRISM